MGKMDVEHLPALSEENTRQGWLCSPWRSRAWTAPGALTPAVLEGRPRGPVLWAAPPPAPHLKPKLSMLTASASPGPELAAESAAGLLL